MNRRLRTLRRLLLVPAAAAALLVVAPAVAQAHPLGNFTINHYDGLTLTPERVDDLAVVDEAEIPTLQARDTIDTDHDGVLEPAELRAYGATRCGAVAASVRVTVDGSPLPWNVNSSTFELLPGAAGLPTSRLTCALTARAHLDHPGRLELSDDLDADHVGWREITALGDGVHIEHSPVPSHSVSGELRHYPDDLLSSPLNVRSADLTVLPGTGADTSPAFTLPSAGLADRWLSHLTSTFTNLVGARRLTFGVGALALLLSLVLGASHAAMPGHGKTVMAAYLAGKNGTKRDALTVGATVTFTHTAGVLLLGLLLSASAALTGESILSWLGVASGLLIAVIGLGLLRSAWRQRRREQHVPATAHGHDHGHEHEHEHVQGQDHVHGHHEHLPGHAGSHRHDQEGPPRQGRRALIGLGVAGGLVPSPSALVVLLGAVALGRTYFGVALVLGYGLGMAATLTAAGLLLVGLRHRARRALPGAARVMHLAAYTPIATALFVVTVGGALALRSLSTF